MNKNGLLIVIIIVIALFGIVYSQFFMPDLAPRPSVSKCDIPPANGLITRSLNLCGGTYYDGIEIVASNIKLKCSGSIFTGYLNPTRANGLLINGDYTNITIEGCTFMAFPQEGIYLKGPANAQNPQKLTGVLLKDVTSFANGGGIKIGENTYQIDIVKGNFSYNAGNGVHLVSEYKDPARYNVNPDPYPKYFPNDVRVINTTISNNNENGIYVDGKEYYRQSDDMEMEDNILIFDGNHINNNFENGIKNTDFFVNVSSDYWSRGESGNYFVANNRIFNNSLAGIKIHVKKTQGPLGNEINCNLSSLSTIRRDYLAISSINNIYWNLIENNDNGIEVVVDSSSTSNSRGSCGGVGQDPRYLATLYRASANRIRFNNESGILYSLKNPLPLSGASSDFSSYLGLGSGYFQNIISFNGNSGVFLNGSTSGLGSNWDSRHSTIALDCNDFIGNRDYGIRVTGRDNLLLNEDLIYVYLARQNILEGNTIGGIYFNYTAIRQSSFGIYYSFIGNHPVFDVYNGVLNARGQLYWNDIINSPLLAFDINSSIVWSQNYWSDYSPGCADVNPADGLCDSPRPIPAANQDIHPKAGLPWGNNARGYLQLDRGVLLQSCNVVNIPPYPSRPNPPVNNSGGGVQTQGEPIGVGIPASSTSSTSSSTSSSGGELQPQSDG